jgi:hypothetical protein
MKIGSREERELSNDMILNFIEQTVIISTIARVITLVPVMLHKSMHQFCFILQL